MNPYFTNAGGVGVLGQTTDQARQKNSQSTGRPVRSNAGPSQNSSGSNTGGVANQAATSNNNLTNRPYQTITAKGGGGLSDRATMLDTQAAIAANAYTHQDFPTAKANQTIDHVVQQQSSSTINGSGQRRAVSNPKTFMRARMAQQTKDNYQLHGGSSRSKSRHANQSHTQETGGSSGQQQQASNAYAVTAPNNVNVISINNSGGTGQKKSVNAGSNKANQDSKKLTQNFMKVPRGAAGLIGGNIDGQASYLAKQQ